MSRPVTRSTSARPRMPEIEYDVNIPPASLRSGHVVVAERALNPARATSVRPTASTIPSRAVPTSTFNPAQSTVSSAPSRAVRSTASSVSSRALPTSTSNAVRSTASSSSVSSRALPTSTSNIMKFSGSVPTSTSNDWCTALPVPSRSKPTSTSKAVRSTASSTSKAVRSTASSVSSRPVSTAIASGPSGPAVATRSKNRSASRLQYEPEVVCLISPPTSPVKSEPAVEPQAEGARALAAPTGRNRGRTSLHVLSEKVQLLLAFESCDCCYCTVQMKEREGIMLHNCLHTFCRECLVSSIELQETAQIMCPISEKCGGYLLDKEIKALVPPAVFQKYVDRSLAFARDGMENAFQCRTIGCDGWCEVDPGSKTFHCYICDQTNCLQCQAIHENIDCSAYQNFLKIAKSTGKEPKDLMEKGQLKNSGWEQLRALVGNGNGNSDLGTVLQQLQNFDLFKSTMEFECPICICDIPAGEGAILQECLHCFCIDCLIGLVKNTDEPEIKCPHIDGDKSCVNYLKPREIKALVPADVYDGYLLRSVKLAENGMTNSYHCKTPDCLGWYELNPEGGDVYEKFKCFLCNKENCVACNAIHEGVSCEDYKNRLVQNENDQLSEAALANMLTSGEALKCPKCKTIVQKTIGCDYMICSACRSDLCWATKGLRWGPLGKGDISGGCKCEYTTGGPKCHPSCQNCH